MSVLGCYVCKEGQYFFCICMCVYMCMYRYSVGILVLYTISQCLTKVNTRTFSLNTIQDHTHSLTI